MEVRQITILILAVAAAVFFIWDVYVAFFNRVPNRRDTFTGVIFGWVFDRKVWLLPYAWGNLTGHLFLPGEGLVDSRTGTMFMLWTWMVVWTLGRLYQHFILVLPWERYARFPWHALILLASGTAVGHFFVPAGWLW